MESRDPIIDAHDFVNRTEVTSGASGDRELEKLFWMCDYAATVSTLELHELEMCGAVIKQLRLATFGGDFDEWIEWYGLNKEAEHEALEVGAEIRSCGQGDKP
ncbi:MAG TPA: hypothetical protein VM937_03810 [Burkholderiaceae bacterium]|nr:hypothetical protein [Burkholderiaceae bacterium]